MATRKTSGESRPKGKRRRGGYRGYGSPLRKEQGGAVHWGRGFSGVGFPGEEGGLLPPTGDLLPDRPRGGKPKGKAK